MYSSILGKLLYCYYSFIMKIKQ